MKVIAASNAEEVRIFHDINRKWRNALTRGKFYAEGEQVIARLLAAHIELEALLISPAYLDQWESLIAKKSGNPTVWVAEKSWMEQNTGQHLNQPCLAIGSVPVPISVEILAAREGCLFVALDGIDHAVNVGSIVRNCAAFQVTGVLLDDRSEHPYSWRAIRSSVGGVFSVPVHSGLPLIQQLQQLTGLGVSLIAAQPEGNESLSMMDFGKPACVIFGSEHDGVSDEVLQLSAHRLALPHSNQVDSLNVAAASAIVLHHAFNDRFSLRSQ